MPEAEMPEAGRPEPPSEPVGADDRWFLVDEQEFLQRSIEDADRELGAGDLSEGDHAVLTQRDRSRLAEVTAALAALGPVSEPEQKDDFDDLEEPEEGFRRRDWRRVGIIGSCFLIIAGVVILVDHALSPRLPGQSSSGSVTLTGQELIEQQLDQAASEANGGDPVEALKLYNKVLSEDPNDPNALAASGWLEWNYGTDGHNPTLQQAGRRNEEKAIKVAPTLYVGHFFLGLILYNQYDNAKAAVVQFNNFLADHPPANEVSSVAKLAAGAYTQAGVPVPAQFTAAAG
jgi:tetratricopeptide (TPR) repeat protein